MHQIRNLVDRTLEYAVTAAMAILVLDVLWQVFTRFILRDASSWTEELARYLLIWVGLLGAAYAAGLKMHLALDLLPTKVEGARKRQLSIFIELCAFAFALAALVIGGTRLVMVSFVLGQTSAALGLPIGYVYLVVPISGLLIMFYSLAHIHEIVTAPDTAEEGSRGVA